MLDLITIGIKLKKARGKESQEALATRSDVSRKTISDLENGRLDEIGYVKLSRLLSCVGLEMKAVTANSGRPTLDDLLDGDEG